ncbi:hypothetical protein EGI05_09750 [Chryseobacterium daecheongense]|uniref:Uncharacterized protein n=1 Tax=Chryseobacterium daecheongense TaxID=192389 RepID=A0A3N0VY36_9FLAO|nr:hypothetical protein EGI05_09750 [Chryseobacterium daecheongense]
MEKNIVINSLLKGSYKKNTFRLGKYSISFFLCRKPSILKKQFFAVEFEKKYDQKRVIVSHFWELRKQDDRTRMIHFKRNQILLKQNGQNNH